MNAEDFRTWLVGQELGLSAWGRYVTATVMQKVHESIGDKRYKNFFKIPPQPRVKTIESALGKFADKNYPDPKRQMTDLVGTRFVVLLRSDVPVVENVLATHTGWTISHDRDPAYEISQEPNVFDYQSAHYLVTSFEDRVLDGIEVPAETTCEVQVRTLLQHAYAELVHDNVYKGEGPIPSEAKRLIARCMALMETTDEMFCNAMEELQEVNTDRATWGVYLRDEFAKITGKADAVTDDQDTDIFLDTYRDLLQLANRSRVIEEAIPAPLRQKIVRRSLDGGLFSKPLCLLVYWLLRKHPRQLIDRWPMGQYEVDLETAMADLAIAR